MFPEFHIDAEGRVETLKARRKGVTEIIFILQRLSQKRK